MGYYRGRGRRRSWGGSRSYTQSKFDGLAKLFGTVVEDIRREFLNIEDQARDELFLEYGAAYGDSAEKYARRTFPKWKSGETSLSGQTMERLVELVPPYLSPAQRYSLLQSLLKLHKKSRTTRVLKINIENPDPDFVELEQVLSSLSCDDVLAHLPERVMSAASWLYGDEVTTLRAMLARAERAENDLLRNSAIRELQLLKKTILTGQVQTAQYSVELPSGILKVVAYKPSYCFISTCCFGQDARETVRLRAWRDNYLLYNEWGRRFIVFYYNHAESLATLISHSPRMRFFSKSCISILLRIIPDR